MAVAVGVAVRCVVAVLLRLEGYSLRSLLRVLSTPQARAVSCYPGGTQRVIPGVLEGYLALLAKGSEEGYPCSSLHSLCWG